MTLDEFRSRYKEQILAIAAKHHASNVRVFGSVANGTATDSSDIDLLVHLDDEASLMDLAALYRELETLCARKVDVVPDEAHIFYPSILQQAVTL